MHRLRAPRGRNGELGKKAGRCEESKGLEHREGASAKRHSLSEICHPEKISLAGQYRSRRALWSAVGGCGRRRVVSVRDAPRKTRAGARRAGGLAERWGLAFCSRREPSPTPCGTCVRGAIAQASSMRILAQTARNAIIGQKGRNERKESGSEVD